ncbi:hypothetical protein STEG23_001710 [Scotinomys teguina]
MGMSFEAFDAMYKAINCKSESVCQLPFSWGALVALERRNPGKGYGKTFVARPPLQKAEKTDLKNPQGDIHG